MSDREKYKLKVIRLESGEIEIVANRTGLRDLAEVCTCNLGEFGER